MKRSDLQSQSGIRKIYKFFFVFFVFCHFGACENTGEEFQIDEKFINIYVELRIATIGNKQNKERAAKSRRLIFDTHQIEPEKYKHYMQKIMAKPETWDVFQAKVLEQLSEIEKVHKGE